MLTGEAQEIFARLEGSAEDAREAIDLLVSLYQSTKEAWFTKSLLQYQARTGSTRALEVLCRAPELHSKFLLDCLLEQIRADRIQRHQALASMASLFSRRPPWLYRVSSHSLVNELLRAATIEKEPVPLLYALLALAMLIPAATTLASKHLRELADIILHPVTLDPPPSQGVRLHLRLAQLALFHTIYAMHPTLLIDTLRAEISTARESKEVLEKGLAPLFASVRLHPALVSGSRQDESIRWARKESHDVVAESRSVAVGNRERYEERIATPRPSRVAPMPVSPVPGSVAYAARQVALLRPGDDGWVSSDKLGAESAPHTPLPAEDTAEPPEAAVEATPENTPAKETRSQFRFPTDSSAVRAFGRRSQPPSPLRKETSPSGLVGEYGRGLGGDAYGAKISKIARERAAALEAEHAAASRRPAPDSPVPFGGAPPAGATVARPEPRGAMLDTSVEPLGLEDREVLELTRGANLEVAWSDNTSPPPLESLRYVDPRRLTRPRTRTVQRLNERARSCDSLLGLRRISTAIQTTDTWPEPYEFIIADYYKSLIDASVADTENTHDPSKPCALLDEYLTNLYRGGKGDQVSNSSDKANNSSDKAVAVASSSELSEQLAMVHAQLMYERWRREAHAERNRRLLGRCRQTRALELQCAALKDRLRTVTRERDEFRSRLLESAPNTPAPHPSEEVITKLEAALAAERAAREQAEAAHVESEALRTIDNSELQRIHCEKYDAETHAEELTQCQQELNTQTEYVRVLRRELLVVAERENKLRDTVDQLIQKQASLADSAETKAEREKERSSARAEIETLNLKLEALTTRTHELENTLVARDGQLNELKKALKIGAEESAARLEALQDKYATALRIVRAAEMRQFAEMTGDLTSTFDQKVTAGPSSNSTAAGSNHFSSTITFADMDKTRDLLFKEEDDHS